MLAKAIYLNPGVSNTATLLHAQRHKQVSYNSLFKLQAWQQC